MGFWDRFKIFYVKDYNTYATSRQKKLMISALMKAKNKNSWSNEAFATLMQALTKGKHFPQSKLIHIDIPTITAKDINGIQMGWDNCYNFVINENEKLLLIMVPKHHAFDEEISMVSYKLVKKGNKYDVIYN